jgi:hypothetical protein
MTGAALATAAAIVAASPGLAPSGSIAAQNAVSKAAYELTTFSDMFTIPTAEVTNVLFGSTSYGGFVGPDNTPIVVEPWASACSYDCFLSGISGVAYLYADALVNGNGNGWDDRDNWADSSIVNYFFEPFFVRSIGQGAFSTVQSVGAGFSAATEYLLQATIGQASPVLSTLIEIAFYGPYLVTIAYDDALTALGDALQTVPVVGPFLGDSIFAYLGSLLAPGATIEDPYYYQFGLSGVLQYWINELTGVYVVPPGSASAASVASPLARAAAAITESVTAPAAQAPAPAVDAVETAPVEAVEAAPVEAVSTTEESAPADVTAADAAESAPVDEVAPTAADVKANAEPVDSPSSTVADATSDATSEEGSAAASAPSKATSKRPVRDAIAKVNKAVTSAVDSAKAGAASAPAAADAG